MTPAVESALMMMVIALPVMFLVITLFILCTMGLVKMFPYKDE